VIDYHFAQKAPLSFRFAIPNHPWVDSSDSADVRVALTVCDATEQQGNLSTVIAENNGEYGEVKVTFQLQVGHINSALRIGVDLTNIEPLIANKGLSSVGCQLSGQGFVLSVDDADRLKQLDSQSNKVIHPLISGRDLAQTRRERFAIDVSELAEIDLRTQFPTIYQWLSDRVRAERSTNAEPRFRDAWWVYSRPRLDFRPILKQLSRVIVTSITAKHRFFQFEEPRTVFDSTCVGIAIDDCFALGVMSSFIHVRWAIRAGGRLGVGDDPRYLKADCFDPFPFPDPDESTRERIRNLGEQLDAHRKRQQELHDGLTMTGMYNVLEKLRAGEALTKKEQAIHEQGLVSVLKELHDKLDEAVCDAYGWPHDIGDEEILQRLVDLNAERAAEEAKGHIRYLRPEFQNPEGTKPKATAKAKVKKQPWPKSLPERIAAVRSVLSATTAPLNSVAVAKRFTHARQTEDGRFVG
jgi:hypothetical protein